jgi:hypothetical protein
VALLVDVRRAADVEALRAARIYDLRSTLISNALARGLTIFEIARIAGMSTSMIELHYGSLLDSARESLLERLEAPDDNAAEAAEGGTR